MRSYQKDSDGKPFDRRQRKSSRRATFEYNKAFAKLVKEKRKAARLEAEKAAEATETV